MRTNSQCRLGVRHAQRETNQKSVFWRDDTPHAAIHCHGFNYLMGVKGLLPIVERQQQYIFLDLAPRSYYSEKFGLVYRSGRMSLPQEDTGPQNSASPPQQVSLPARGFACTSQSQCILCHIDTVFPSVLAGSSSTCCDGGKSARPCCRTPAKTDGADCERRGSVVVHKW